MSDLPIRYMRPVMPAPEEWLPYLKDSYAIGYYANFGPAAREFERKLKQRYARGRAALSSPSATTGLVTALMGLGVHGKVLTPSHTFPATTQAILMAGCTPVFGDIGDDSWELDPAAAEQALARHPDIRAILHVRAYGFGHDLSHLQSLADAKRIPLIIDAASALGCPASVSGHVGQQGAVEVFSLHATKVFGIGEGAVLFMDPQHDATFRTASNFGMDYPDIVAAGLNNKMSDFQAAIGLAVLERIDGFIRHRQSVVARYRKTLSRLGGVHQAPPPELAPWQCYPVRLRAGMDVERIIGQAAEQGLELRHGYYKPLHRTSYFSRYADAPLPITDAVSESLICLPVYSDMSDELADRVLEIFVPLIS